MKLTPLDIRHKEFKRGMRGYADVEVDEFLDEVADEYERLFKENIDLQDRVEALEEKVAGYKRIEDTLQKTLVNAQASAEEQKQNASKQAQLILQDAELKARQMVNEAYSERQAIEQGMAKLRSAEEDFRYKFRSMIEGYLRQCRTRPRSPRGGAGGRAETDFARHAEAIKEAIARESAAPEPAGRGRGAGSRAGPRRRTRRRRTRRRGSPSATSRRARWSRPRAAAAACRPAARPRREPPGRRARHHHGPAAAHLVRRPRGQRPHGPPLRPPRTTSRGRAANASCSARPTTCSPTSTPG